MRIDLEPLIKIILYLHNTPMWVKQIQIQTNKPDFIEEIPLNKIKYLLNANSELLAEVGDFINQSTELQKRGPCRLKV